MKRANLAAAAALTALALLAAACGGDGDEEGAEETPVAVEEDGAPTVVAVNLAEFSVTPAETSAPAGAVEFRVTNAGAGPHELVVIRTDLAADALPAEGSGVDEGSGDLEVVGEVEPLTANATEALTVDLGAGSYVLICNIPGHYEAGMRAAFTVG